jgi:aryl-alcohol dehydrogenase-like predicted oxidoreductase
LGNGLTYRYVVRYVEAAGVRLSAIGVGTWQFGSREWGYGSSYAEGEAGRIVRRALDLGVNLIDTAEVYAFGRSERIVGAALAGRRDEAFVATKIMPVAPWPAVIQQRGRASLRRLGLDAIDLYQIHQPNPVVPLRQQMAGMRALLDAGVIRHAGVSNFSLPRWRDAEDALGRPVLSNQVQMSLVHRQPIADLVPWASVSERVVIAYSPLGQGLLSARYGPDNAPRSGVRALNPLFLPDNLERAAPLLDTLRRIGAAHDATAAQVALAWVVEHPNVVAIPGASSVEQLERNVEAADLELDHDELAELNTAAAAFRPVLGVAAAPRLIRRLLPIP